MAENTEEPYIAYQKLGIIGTPNENNDSDYVLVLNTLTGMIDRVSKASISGGGGGSQNLQQTLGNGSTGNVESDILIQHSTGANTASIGLTDGYVSASAGDNQFGLNEQEGSFTSQLRIFERLIVMSGGSSAEVAFSGTELNFIIDGIVRGSINAEGRLTIVNEDGFSGRFAPDNLTGSRTYALPDEDGTLALRENTVPYTGATANLDMGDYEIKAYSYRDANNNIIIDEAGIVNSRGSMQIQDIASSGNTVNIGAATITSGRSYQLPDKNGTFAMVSDTIPITGTETGSPVTGNLEVYAGFKVFSEETGYSELKFPDDNSGIEIIRTSVEGFSGTMAVSPSGITFTSDLPAAFGIRGAQDFSANYQSLDYVQKVYVDNLIAGLTFKTNVKTATTANIAIASAPASIDGITLSNGDRVLLKNQTDATQNGIYIFNGTGSNLTRSTDADTGAELANKTIPVDQGTANADSWWTVTNDSITLGTTNITLSKTAGQGLYNAGTGIDITGSTISIAAAYTSARDAYADGRVAQTITNGVTTSAPSQDAVFDALALKANIDSPTFTGVPSGPTAAAGTNTTQFATTEFVRSNKALDRNFSITANATISTSATNLPANGMITYFCNAASGAITLTLAGASNLQGYTVHVIKTDSSANAVTIQAPAGVNINAANTFVLANQYERANIKSNATQFYLF